MTWNGRDRNPRLPPKNELKMIYHILYKTVNVETDEFYVGIHSTEDLNDGYLGSGTLLEENIKNYGIEKFKREILYYGNNRLDIEQNENQLLASLVQNNKCLNLIVDGSKGWYKISSEEKKNYIRNKISYSLKGNKNRAMWIKKNPEIHRTRCKKAAKIRLDKQTPLYERKQKELSTSINWDEINFSKYGWKKVVSELIKQPHQKVSKWMERFKPEIYNTAFNRKSPLA